MNNKDHTTDCVGGPTCGPVDGQWAQPAGWAVEQARAQMDDDAPWCQISAVAFEIEGE